MKKMKSLGTIAIIESERLTFLVGPELARILSRDYVDLRRVKKEFSTGEISFVERVLKKLRAFFSPQVVSLSLPVVSQKSRVIYIDSVIDRMIEPQKAEVVRRVLLKMRESIMEAK